jgi:hypothetical protein
MYEIYDNWIFFLNQQSFVDFNIYNRKQSKEHSSITSSTPSICIKQTVFKLYDNDTRREWRPVRFS